MKRQKLLIVGLAIAIGAVVASLMFANRKTQPPVLAGQPPVTPASVVAKSTLPANAPVDQANPVMQTTPAMAAADANPQKPPTQAAPQADASSPLMINGYVVQDLMARAALSYVGADPDATAYWLGAIEDPNLPSEERKDLIEDLNEDGLSDPKNPGVQDVPLIASRIELIEQIAASETDPVNLDALAEAHKDLVNMLNGKPVQ